MKYVLFNEKKQHNFFYEFIPRDTYALLVRAIL
jgi:hypothetical protein